MVLADSSSPGLLWAVSRKMARFVWIFLKSLGLALVVFVAATLVFVFATPKFTVNAAQIRWAVERLAPNDLVVRFAAAEIEVLRPEGKPLAKHVKIRAQDLCARYKGTVVRACFSEVALGLMGGWSAPRAQDRAFYMPGLLAIDPVRLLDGGIRVDLEGLAQTPTWESEKESKNDPRFSLANVLNTSVLSKWRMEGSRIEIENFELKTADTAYLAAFDLTTPENGEILRAVLHRFQAADGEPLVRGVLRLSAPRSRAQTAPRSRAQSGDAWLLTLDAGMDLEGPLAVKARARAEIQEDGRSVDFDVATEWEGVSTLDEVHLEGTLKNQEIQALVSVDMGSESSRIQVLNFVNCGVYAHLARQVGELKCGPQTVRLQLREREILRDKNLYTLAPEFVLRVDRFQYGPRLEADLTFAARLEHLGIADLSTRVDARVVRPPDEPLRYEADGDATLVIKDFRAFVKLLGDTPFAVPAPLSVLAGTVTAKASSTIGEELGVIDYSLETDLKSEYQALDIGIAGKTELITVADGFEPMTSVDVALNKVHLSFPRFDLKVPPQLLPDDRFGPVNEKELISGLRDGVDEEPMDFRMRIHTTRPKAIRIATNLTGAPIPVDLDLQYDSDRTRRAPASILTNKVYSVPQRRGDEPADESPVRGRVVIGPTPVELFRRDARIQVIHVDLLPNGTTRLDGQVTVQYLDYSIYMELDGEVTDPQIQLHSNPALEDEQILSVLLFGRPIGELDEEEKSSVTNLNSAFTDAVLGLSSLYVLANTPIESVGYDPERQMVTAKVGLGGGASVEFGTSGEALAGVGFQKRLSSDFVLRSDVERIGATGERTVSAFVEWMRRF